MPNDESRNILMHKVAIAFAVVALGIPAVMLRMKSEQIQHNGTDNETLEQAKARIKKANQLRWLAVAVIGVGVPLILIIGVAMEIWLQHHKPQYAIIQR